MTDSAVRQRRLRERRRRHGQGDHSMCLPTSCEVARAASVDLDAAGLNEPGEHGAGDAAGDVTRDVTPSPKNSGPHREPPAGLGPRGSQLWEEMAGLKLGPTHVLTLERLCRMADRLDRLDELLKGGDWLDLAIQRTSTDTTLEVRVTVDRAVGEVRQHEVAMKLLVAELRHAGRPVAPPTGVSPPGPGQGSEDDDDDEPRAGWTGNVTSIAGILGKSAPG